MTLIWHDVYPRFFFKKNVHQVWCVFWKTECFRRNLEFGESNMDGFSPINQPKFLKNVWNNFWVNNFFKFWRYVCCRWFFSLFLEDWGMHSPIPIDKTYESLTRKALAGMWRWWKWANRLAAPSWLIQGTGRLEMSTMVQFFWNRGLQ